MVSRATAREVELAQGEGHKRQLHLERIHMMRVGQLLATF